MRFLLALFFAVVSLPSLAQVEYSTSVMGLHVNTDPTASCTGRAKENYGSTAYGMFRVPDGWTPNIANTTWTGVPQRATGDGPCRYHNSGGSVLGNTSMGYRFVACTSGKTYDAATNSCVTPPPTCPAAGTNADAGRVTLSAAQKAATASNGGYYYWRDDNSCVVKMSLDVCTTGDNGVTWQCAGTETYTGGYDTGAAGDGTGSGSSGTSTTKSTTPPAGQETQPTTCPTGQCPGEINGLNVCKPCSSISTKVPKVEEKTNSDGTKEQNTTLNKTTCTAGQCSTESTTTTVSKDSSGAVVGTSTTTTVTQQSKGDFCKDNPNAVECKDQGGDFSGSCDSGFVCSGDAVQCAQARAAQEMHCTAKKIPDGVGEVTGGLLDAGIPEGLHLDGPALSAPAAVTGSCAITDFSVDLVFGQSLTVPLSQFCQFMDTLRAVIGVLGVLAFSVIVFRG